MFVPVHPNQSTSPFAMELGQKLDSVIREYRQSHPGMSTREVRDALRIAEASSDAGGIRKMLPALIPAAFIAWFLLEGISRRWGTRPAPSISIMVVVLGIILAALLIRVARR